jgi:hypothetical protein
MVGGGVNETWSWDGSKWQQIKPSSSPDGRQSSSLALDPVHGQLILFGGISLTRGILKDTWTWNGDNWTQLSPTSSPPPRFRATIQSWTAHRVVILWGGVAADVLSDAWQWDGGNWTQIASPGMRADAAAIDLGSQILFFGGDSTGGLYNDLQTFDGTNWSRLS